MSSDPTTKTGLDLITGALRKIGQYAPGETLSAADATDALDSLNGLLDVWSMDKLAVFNDVENIMNLSSGQYEYTLGIGGYFNIERPLRISKMYSRITTGNGEVDFPCELITLQKYGSIGLKNQPGPWPKMAYYNTAYPLSSLQIWPVPQWNIEFHLWTSMVFSSLDLATVLTMPRGYYMALQWGLAEILCPEYGIQASADIRRFAKAGRDLIKALNATPLSEVPVDGSIVSHSGSDASFILHGGFQ